MTPPKIFWGTPGKIFRFFSKKSKILPKILKFLIFFGHLQNFFGVPPGKFSVFFSSFQMGYFWSAQSARRNSPLGFRGSLTLPAAERLVEIFCMLKLYIYNRIVYHINIKRFEDKKARNPPSTQKKTKASVWRMRTKLSASRFVAGASAIPQRRAREMKKMPPTYCKIEPKFFKISKFEIGFFFSNKTWRHIFFYSRHFFLRFLALWEKKIKIRLGLSRIT